MNILIERFRKYPNEVLSLIYLNEVPRFAGIENPECLIPRGVYRAIRDLHNGKYECWEFVDVPERTQIQIHIANLGRQLRGCIGIGYRFGDLSGENAILQSTIAFNDFMDRTANEEELIIEVTQQYV